MPVVGGDPDRLRAVAGQLERVAERLEQALGDVRVAHADAARPVPDWVASLAPMAEALRVTASELRSRAATLEATGGPGAAPGAGGTTGAEAVPPPGAAPDSGISLGSYLINGSGDADLECQLAEFFMPFIGRGPAPTAAGLAITALSMMGGFVGRAASVATSLPTMAVASVVGLAVCDIPFRYVPVSPINQSRADDPEWTYGENDIENNSGMINCGSDCSP